MRPQLDSRLFPTTERDDAEGVMQNLDDLQSHALEFEHSFALAFTVLMNRQRDKERAKAGGQRFDSLSENGKMLNSWQLMALRNGAILAYGYQEILQALNGHLGAAPVLQSLVDTKMKRRGSKRFKDTFPQITGARTAVAHPGEFGSTRKKMAENATKERIHTQAGSFGGGGGTTFINSMIMSNGDVFSFGSTFRGRFVQYELSRRTCIALCHATDEIWTAFSPVIQQFQLPFPRAGVPQQS